MTAEHGSANENLLEQIATTEQELEQKVAQARDAARRIVDEARARAESERQAAAREAEELSARARSETAREAETVTQERLADAKSEADRVRAQAAERMAVAVKTIVDRVLSGLENGR